MKPRVIDISDAQQETIKQPDPDERKHNFLLMEILACVACGALTVFSFYSSALEYYNNLGNADSAGIRTIGIQLGIIVFGGLAVMQLFTVRRVVGLTRIGCICGSIIATVLTIFLFIDSASTSYSYQDYKLGQRTGDDRELEASIHQYEVDASAAAGRFRIQLDAVEERRKQLTKDREELNSIIGPAVKAGTRLRQQYSDDLVTNGKALASNSEEKSRIEMERHHQLTELDKTRSEEATKLRSSNSSGAKNVGRMFGINASKVILIRTLLCELALVALAIMFGVGLFYTSKSTPADRMRNYSMSIFHCVWFFFVFFVAWNLFMSQVQAGPAQEDVRLPAPQSDQIYMPAVPNGSGTYPDTERGTIDTSLFDKEWKKSGERFNDPFYHQTGSVNCPIPTDIYMAIDRLDEEPRVKAVIAAAGFKESSWNVNAYGYDGDGGYAHGWLQLHSYWRKDDVAWMKKQPGGWRNADVNLGAFFRCLREHERFWPNTKSSWRRALARYNGGGTPNYEYADSILEHSRDLEKYFNRNTY